MAIPSRFLIEALRTTADRLVEGNKYSWTHQGHCNCGQLVQTLVGLPAAEIHRAAIQRPGDWSEKVRDYCPGSGIAIDTILKTLLWHGLTSDDIVQLERLSDWRVYPWMMVPAAELDYRDPAHVIAYLRGWALQLEAQLEAQPLRVPER